MKGPPLICGCHTDCMACRKTGCAVFCVAEKAACNTTGIWYTGKRKITALPGACMEEMDMRRWTVCLLAGALLLCLLPACGGDAPAAGGDLSAGETRKVVDMLGREVEVPVEIHRVVCTGSNALRLVCYLQGLSLIHI